MRMRRPVVLGLLAAVLVSAGTCAFVTRPLATRQGVDFQVTEYRIPAYVKATDFVQRHFQYQLLASRICGGSASPRECVMALLEWTRRTIPQTPVGWPVVDDHPLHIVIRGHGTDDQMADIFTTLAVYAGVPAFFRPISIPERRVRLPLSFVQLDGRWIPIDVASQKTFTNRAGGLASVDELLNDPDLVVGHAAGSDNGGLPYSAYINRATLAPFVVPPTLRPSLQQPLPRLRYELRRAVGWERE